MPMIPSFRPLPTVFWLPAGILLFAVLTGAGAAPSPVRPIGDVTFEHDIWRVGDQPATLVIGEPDLSLSRVRLALQPAADTRAPIELIAMPENADDPAQNAAARVSIARDTAGRRLTATLRRFDAEQAAWQEIGRTRLDFWPEGGGALQYAERDGLEPRSWHDRWLNLRVDAEADALTFWLEGRLIGRFDRPADARGPLAVRLAPNDQVRAIEIESSAETARFVPIDLDPYVNAHMASPLAAARVTAEGVPFALARDAGGILDLRYAAWIERQRDPASMIERFYDGAGSFPHDPRMPMLRIPAADYMAAHILAVADADEAAFSDIVTLRAGRYDNPTHGAVIQHDFSARVPRYGAAQPAAAGTPDEPLYYARIPMTHAFAQDILSLPNPGRGAEPDDARRLRQGFIDIEVTKEVRLARRQPDPNRFRHRPLGLPSGVRIAAITFEQSPLQMRVTSTETGHAFVEPQEPVFTVMLTNITDTERTARLTLEATHLDGTHTSVARTASVPAGDTATLEISVPTQKRGYHTLAVILSEAEGEPLLRRETAFALLPPDRRQHRAQSPFGTWAFDGDNYTPSDQDLLGPLYVKLGLRYGMFRANTDELLRYGVVPGNEPQVQGAAGPDRYEGFRERCATAGLAWPGALIFHEQSISGRHVTRVPDLFADRPAYRLTEQEQQRFDDLWEQGIAGATAMRERFPQAHLRLGNGPVPFKEELYRRGFPSELFDSAGNEAGSYGRPPETQPPDWVANNASLWMDRILLDAYGYADKPVTQCYEITYPGTNPGNLDYSTQADYMVRHALHSLAWEIPEIKLGLITDVGCSYYFSNWGSAGFSRAQPEMSVKPSFVSFATMTLVLDGARYRRAVPLGSPSLYALEFTRPDGGHAYALWTLRGRRPVTFSVEGADWTLIDDQANENQLTAVNGRVTAPLSPSPLYLVGAGRVTGAEAGTPVYDDAPLPGSSRLGSLFNLENWTLETARDPELEAYSFMTPRRRGDFAFEPVASFEGRENVLKVTPRPIEQGKDTMPMYAVLTHDGGLAVPGQPTEIGMWVNGNSGWGRIHYELTDASGQRWMSIGAQQPGDYTEWLRDWLPDGLFEQFDRPGISDWNTEDVFGIGAFNFDGWRFLSFPLPGNYPGERYGWPANSQWRSDGDGIVRYPLTLRKVVVELREKVLHLRDFDPPPRPEIYLSEIMTGKGPELRTNR